MCKYHGLVEHQCSLDEFGNVADVSAAPICPLEPDPAPRIFRIGSLVMVVVVCLIVMLMVISIIVMMVVVVISFMVVDICFMVKLIRLLLIVSLSRTL